MVDFHSTLRNVKIMIIMAQNFSGWGNLDWCSVRKPKLVKTWMEKEKEKVRRKIGFMRARKTEGGLDGWMDG
jgi:hypothetical protein